MDQKTQFIADYLRHSLSFSELCALYHVSRKTGYKWVSRYTELGAPGLEDRSRRPHASPHQTPDELVAAISDLLGLLPLLESDSLKLCPTEQHRPKM